MNWEEEEGYGGRAAPPRSGLVQLKLDTLKGVMFDIYMVDKMAAPVKPPGVFW